MAKVIEIDNTKLNQIVDLAIDSDIAVDIFEGTLIDNYIIYNMKAMKIGGILPDYVIMNAKYLNEWSSLAEMILANDSKLVDEYIERWGGYDED